MIEHERIAAILAERVLGWRVGPERFLLGNRQWITRSQFRPFDRVQDAFRLLRKASIAFSLTKTTDGGFTATVRVGDLTGTASGRAEAATITLAIARVVGLETGGKESAKTGMGRQ
jgi:hypothetical protein